MWLHSQMVVLLPNLNDPSDVVTGPKPPVATWIIT